MKSNFELEYEKNFKQRLLNRKQNRICNICTEKFTPKTVFDRYCSTCKHESELLKFSEWLPELDPSIPEKISA